MEQACHMFTEDQINRLVRNVPGIEKSLLYKKIELATSSFNGGKYNSTDNDKDIASDPNEFEALREIIKAVSYGTSCCTNLFQLDILPSEFLQAVRLIVSSVERCTGYSWCVIIVFFSTYGSIEKKKQMSEEIVERLRVHTIALTNLTGEYERLCRSTQGISVGSLDDMVTIVLMTSRSHKEETILLLRRMDAEEAREASLFSTTRNIVSEKSVELKRAEEEVQSYISTNACDPQEFSQCKTIQNAKGLLSVDFKNSSLDAFLNFEVSIVALLRDLAPRALLLLFFSNLSLLSRERRKGN
jgi:hypothetical protein